MAGCRCEEDGLCFSPNVAKVVTLLRLEKVVMERGNRENTDVSVELAQIRNRVNILLSRLPTGIDSGFSGRVMGAEDNGEIGYPGCWQAAFFHGEPEDVDCTGYKPIGSGCDIFRIGR